MADTFNAASVGGTVAYSGNVGALVPDESEKLESVDIRPTEGQTEHPISVSDVEKKRRMYIDVDGKFHLTDKEGQDRLTIYNPEDDLYDITLFDSSGQERLVVYDDFSMEFLDDSGQQKALYESATGVLEIQKVVQGSGVAATPGATINLNANEGSVFVWQPGEDETVNISNISNGQFIALMIRSTGVSRNITFSSGFKSSGVLATGTDAGKIFVISFVGFSNSAYEIGGRTAYTE